jgi:hypothetical protein
MCADYKPWPDVANFNDEVTVTEMIDGAGAFAIHIERLKFDKATGELAIRPGDVIDFNHGDMNFVRLTAQSRTRLITPRDDNHGFAKWVQENASGLAATLGEGIHYGEWWGYKINRGYGLAKGDKRFSLYNTERWSHLDGSQVAGLWCVPVLDKGSLFTETNEDTGVLDMYTPVHFAVEDLRAGGSVAAPGYDRPEGVVVFHTSGRVMFKYLLEQPEVKQVDPFASVRARGTDRYEPLRKREDQEDALTALEHEAYDSGSVIQQTLADLRSGGQGTNLWEGLV